jgi:hypothetical protein
MIFDANTLKEATDGVERLVGGGFGREDARRLLMLVSRVQWQLGHLISDVAEEVTRI